MIAVSVQVERTLFDALSIVAKKISSGKGKFRKFYLYLKLFKINYLEIIYLGNLLADVGWCWHYICESLAL